MTCDKYQALSEDEKKYGRNWYQNISGKKQRIKEYVKK